MGSHVDIEKNAKAAQTYLASHGHVQSFDNPWSGLHTSLEYFCCYTASQKSLIKAALSNMTWYSFDVRYDTVGCNLDHNNQTIYLHGMPSNQSAFFSFAHGIEHAVRAAGVPINHPRKSLFHMTLARVGYDYPVDSAVASFKANQTRFGTVTVSSFTIDGDTY